MHFRSADVSELAESGHLGHLDDWLFEHATAAQRQYQEQNKQNPLENTNWFVHRYIEELRKRRAVWCWYNSDIESAAMWSVYGHAGIAVGSTIEGLRTSLPHKVAFQIAPIFYNDHRVSGGNHLNPENPNHLPYVHRPHLIKGREYEHEREIRVVTRCYPDQTGRLVRGIAFHTLIKRFIISPVLPPQEALAVERFLKGLDWTGPRPQISPSTLIPDEAGPELLDKFDELFDADLDANESTPDMPQQVRAL
jgi:hypothetical protein